MILYSGAMTGQIQENIEVIPVAQRDPAASYLWDTYFTMDQIFAPASGVERYSFIVSHEFGFPVLSDMSLNELKNCISKWAVENELSGTVPMHQPVWDQTCSVSHTFVSNHTDNRPDVFCNVEEVGKGSHQVVFRINNRTVCSTDHPGVSHEMCNRSEYIGKPKTEAEAMKEAKEGMESVLESSPHSQWMSSGNYSEFRIRLTPSMAGNIDQGIAWNGERVEIPPRDLLEVTINIWHFEDQVMYGIRVITNRHNNDLPMIASVVNGLYDKINGNAVV